MLTNLWSYTKRQVYLILFQENMSLYNVHYVGLGK